MLKSILRLFQQPTRNGRARRPVAQRSTAWHGGSCARFWPPAP